MTKYTSGPWEVKAINEGKDLSIESKRLYIASISRYGNNIGDLEQANAHLIAAAPELLEACKNALTLLERHKIMDMPTHALSQAIAKAEEE